jgi:mitogen-activated protein kinase organizer 1
MDKTVILWDVSTGQAVRKYRGHLATVNSVKFNEESTVTISGSMDTTIRCWDCRSKKPDAFQIMDDAKDSISSVQVSEHEILAGSLDGRIRRYDIRNGEMVSDEMGRKNLLYSSSNSRSYSLFCVDFTCRIYYVRLVYPR